MYIYTYIYMYILPPLCFFSPFLPFSEWHTHVVATDYLIVYERTKRNLSRMCKIKEWFSIFSHFFHRASGGKEAQLAEIREYEVFWDHYMRGPARTGRGGVRWLIGGKAKAQGRGNEWRAVACHYHHVFLRVYLFITDFCHYAGVC